MADILARTPAERLELAIGWTGWPARWQPPERPRASADVASVEVLPAPDDANLGRLAAALRTLGARAAGAGGPTEPLWLDAESIRAHESSHWICKRAASTSTCRLR